MQNYFSPNGSGTDTSSWPGVWGLLVFTTNLPTILEKSESSEWYAIENFWDFIYVL